MITAKSCRGRSYWEYGLFTPKAISEGEYRGKLIDVAALTKTASRANIASILAAIAANIFVC
jgi:hypothetical protein